ncbi:MAG: AraC family transcriptional regulator [Deltaproteobacteria bacterium]|jgi:AraC-like DNA-binding protein|nr:AraC family transcriptional regulator [Deltaproteobacteria bacterium]
MGGPRYKPRDESADAAPGAGQLRPSLHPTYARLLAAELKRRGFSDDQIFEETRLSWTQLLQEERFVSFEQFRRLARRGMDLTGEGWLGLDVGRSTQISSHGPLGYAMVASQNVGQVLDLVERYSALRLRIADFGVEHEAGRVRLRVTDAVGWSDLSEYVSLHIVGALCLLLETVTGMRLPDTRIAFAYPKPAWVDEYGSRFGDVTLQFDAPVAMIDMPDVFAATPCITADAAALRQAVGLCDRAKERRQGDEDAAQRVLDRLLDRQGDYPTLSEMAKDLYMSNRTLIRKLKAQGTSYQMLLDDVRQELAVWYLRHSEMPVEAIAERLGYRDTSNFSRTCKRWFGLTPREIRGRRDGLGA